MLRYDTRVLIVHRGDVTTRGGYFSGLPACLPVSLFHVVTRQHDISSVPRSLKNKTVPRCSQAVPSVNSEETIGS